MKLKITVHGVAYEVDVEVLDAGSGFPAGGPSPLPPVNGGRKATTPYHAESPPLVRNPMATLSETSAPAGSITSPIAGTVLEVKCRKGDEVEAGQELIVVEAMKMEASISAPGAGRIKSIDVSAGDAIRENQVVAQYE